MSDEATPPRIGRTTRKQLITRIIAGTAIAIGVSMTILAVVGVVEIYYSISSRSQVVYSGSHTVDQTGFVIPCDSPLRHTRRATEIRVTLAEKWKDLDRTSDIQLEDGRYISLKVVLVDVKGKEYQRTLDEGSLESRSVNFSDLGRARIREVRLYASEPVHCTKVEWVNWSPM